MVSTVRAVYGEIPLAVFDTTLRVIVLNAWVLGGTQLRAATKDTFLTLVKEVPSLLLNSRLSSWAA